MMLDKGENPFPGKYSGPFWSRVLRRTAAAAITLGILGYFLGQGFLFAHRALSGGAYNVENERVLWQSPLTMAILGIFATFGMEAIAEAIRKPSAVRMQHPTNHK